MNTDLNYAPVIIPTLCRHEHLKRCLESLNACTGAEYTDVYVGVDFPSKEAHFEGWKKVNDFLDHFNPRFHRFIVLKREKNLGPSDNTRYLRQEADIIDSYIFSEDDNEFSPNFLVYMNKALQSYKNDAKVMAICGYNIPVSLFDDGENTYASYETNAWGTGRWLKKNEEIQKINNPEFYKAIFSSYKKIWKIYCQEPRLLNTLLYLIQKNRAFGDTSLVCYQLLNDKVSIWPKISLVRNHGFDGSGTNIIKQNAFFAHQTIDEQKDFDLSVISTKMKRENRKIVNKYHSRAKWMHCAIFIRVFLYKLFKFDFVNLLPENIKFKLLH